MLSPFQSTQAGSTVRSNPQKEFYKLDSSYRSGHLLPEQYFAKVDSLTHNLFSKGIHFGTRELSGLLDLYQEIAWSKPQYSRGRISYYFLFFNNARMFKKKGASMYYAEKITEEYKKIGEQHPFVEQLQKCKIYQEQRLYNKVIEVFKGEKKYMEKLPELLSHNRTDEAVGLNAMYILSPVLTGYIKMNNAVGVRETITLSRAIGAAIQHKYPIKRSQMLYNDLLMIDAEHSLANFHHRYDLAKNLLDRMETLKTTYKDQAIGFIDINLVRMRIENYLNLKNPDSLATYIKKYAASANFGKSQSADIEEFEAKLQALRGNYNGAYKHLGESLKNERELQAALMTESSDLLYAYTQAEDNALALQKAEHAKQQRTQWLIYISIFASVLVLSIYSLMIYRDRKAKRQIQILNNSADMQVITMEEAKYQAARAEQQRLGQELHDGLSSSIASFRHQLELLSMDIEDNLLKSKFLALRAEMANAYQTVRNKSHEWFGAADAEQEQSFEKQIRLLTDGCLPNNRYKKTIHIDDHSLTTVGTDIRITLLRIIQEAVTNIIKHAKAKSIEILIYSETDSLVLTVSDDGVRLEEKKMDRERSSIGLESIRRRAQYLNGEARISSGVRGTEIMVTIPFKGSTLII